MFQAVGPQSCGVAKKLEKKEERFLQKRKGAPIFIFKFLG